MLFRLSVLAMRSVGSIVALLVIRDGSESLLADRNVILQEGGHELSSLGGCEGRKFFLNKIRKRMRKKWAMKVWSI